MNNENKEMLNDSLLIKATKDSYMKKEDLIKMIENIRISCITGYKIKINDNGNKYVQTLGLKLILISCIIPRHFNAFSR